MERTIPPELVRVGDRIRLEDGTAPTVTEKVAVETVKCLCDDPCDHVPEQRVTLIVRHRTGSTQRLQVYGKRPISVEA